MSWQRLGNVPTDKLTDARLQLHWALQIPASVGFTYLEAQPDWSHSSLSWDPDSRALVTGLVDADTPFRAGLRLEDMTLLLQCETPLAFSMDQHDLERGYRWLKEHTRNLRGSKKSAAIVRPNHEMPDHDVAEGSAFTVDRDACAELAHWYANADLVLQSVSNENGGASPVRCWPHHFDIATLIKLDDASGEKARSIGVGMSPGDHSLPFPYWYVTPWPYPATENPPELTLGQWNVEGWFGASLSAGELFGAKSARAQQHIAHSFVTEAIAMSRILLSK